MSFNNYPKADWNQYNPITESISNKNNIHKLSSYSNIKGYLLNSEKVRRIHINGSELNELASAEMKSKYDLFTADIKEVTWFGEYLNKWIFHISDINKTLYKYNSSYEEYFGKDRDSSQGKIDFSQATINFYAERKTMTRLRKILTSDFERNIKEKYRANFSLPDFTVAVKDVVDIGVDNDTYVNGEYSIEINNIRNEKFSIFYKVLGKVEFVWIPFFLNGLSGKPVKVEMAIEYEIERTVSRKTN